MRHDVDAGELDFLIHIPFKQHKTSAFRQARMDYGINPAKAYACGDEKKAFVAALSSGMHPFVVSYGFENFERLSTEIGVPAEVISQTPLSSVRGCAMHLTPILLAPSRSGIASRLPAHNRDVAKTPSVPLILRTLD